MVQITPPRCFYLTRSGPLYKKFGHLCFTWSFILEKAVQNWTCIPDVHSICESKSLMVSSVARNANVRDSGSKQRPTGRKPQNGVSLMGRSVERLEFSFSSRSVLISLPTCQVEFSHTLNTFISSSYFCTLGTVTMAFK